MMASITATVPRQRIEAEARRAAEQRVAEAEAELARLQAELAELRGSSPPDHQEK